MLIIFAREFLFELTIFWPYYTCLQLAAEYLHMHMNREQVIWNQVIMNENNWINLRLHMLFDAIF